MELEKTKDSALAEKIPLMVWLESGEGRLFSRLISKYGNCVDDNKLGFCELRKLTLREFAEDGWIHDWVLNGEEESFPLIDRDTKGKVAFDRLYSVMEKNTENEALLLTYGPDFSDNREDYAFECLKVICDDPNFPPYN